MVDLNNCIRITTSRDTGFSYSISVKVNGVERRFVETNHFGHWQLKNCITAWPNLPVCGVIAKEVWESDSNFPILLDLINAQNNKLETGNSIDVVGDLRG